MKFSDREKSFAVEVYLKTGSFKKSKREFQKKFDSRISPSKQRISSWTSKFREIGSVHDQNAGRSGRLRQGRSDVNVDALAESVRENPERSVRRRLLATGLDISVTTTWRILKKDLNLTAYHISTAHSLTDRDKAARSEMCRVFLDKMEAEPGWRDNIWFSDESHFYLSGKVSKTNCVIWGSQKPDRVNVLCKFLGQSVRQT